MLKGRQNLRKFLIELIFTLIILLIITKTMNSYLGMELTRKVQYAIGLLVVGVEFLYLLIDMATRGKIYLIDMGFITFVAYEIIRSAMTDTIYFPKAINTIFTWPLTIIVFYHYAKHYEITPYMKRVSKAYMVFFYLISLLLVAKHLSGDGNVGGVIFPIYYGITFLPLALSTITQERKRLILMLMTFLYIVVSMKRGGLLALMFGIIVYFFIDAYIQGTLRERYKKYLRYIGMLTVSIILVVIAINVWDIGIVERIRNMTEDGGSGRNSIWIYVMRHFNESSVIEKYWGHGFQSVYYQLRPYGINRLAHNSFIEYLYDYGYIGLTLLILVVVYLIKTTIKMIKQKDKNASLMAYTMVVTLVFSMVSYFFDDSSIIIPFAVFWGYCIGNFNKRKYVVRK